ncbi:15034_t:CDS:2, partial [Acaulospora colombiana]
SYESSLLSSPQSRTAVVTCTYQVTLEDIETLQDLQLLAFSTRISLAISNTFATLGFILPYMQDREVEHSYPYFSHWTLPSLIYLEITGSFLSPPLGYEEDVARFLRKVGSNLRGLVLDVHAIPQPNADPVSLPSSIWTHFVRLETVCIKLSAIDLVPFSIMSNISEMESRGFWDASQIAQTSTKPCRQISTRLSIYSFRLPFLRDDTAREVINELHAYISTDECRERMEWDSRNLLCYYMWPLESEEKEDEAEFTDGDDGSETDSSNEVE